MPVLVPAIDLLDGKVVRLTQGQESQSTIYAQNPIAVAKQFMRQGAKRIHIIDLSAAFGKPSNVDVIKEILQETQIPIQVGGGIRSKEYADKLITNGVNQIILGSILFQDPSAADEILHQHSPSKIIAAVDYDQNQVKIKGWTKTVPLDFNQAVHQLQKRGYQWLLTTNIRRDGTLLGPDITTLERVSKIEDLKIIAAGGIGTLDHLKALSRTRVSRIVIGKALYENKFTFSEALSHIENIK